MSGQFRYRAATSEGQVVEGVLDATSQQNALEELRRQRLFPVDVERVADRQRAATRRSMARTPALALFVRTLATMLHAGVALDRALAFGAEQARHADLANAARAVHASVQSGATLAGALSQHPHVFGPLVVAIVAAGEESGALDESLAQLADHLDAATELRAQLRAALLYPALMAVVSVLGIAVLLLFVVPRLIGMLDVEGVTLPVSTRVLLLLGNTLAAAWWVILLAALAGAFAFRSWLADAANTRRLHAWRLTLPVAGELELKYATARFTRALGLMLRSGRPLLPALRTARTAVSNRAVGARIEAAAEAVSHGKRLHVAVADTVTPLAAELIAVGEESGRLDELCLQIADAHDRDVRRTLESLVAIVQPALILFFGLIVGLVALAMLQAIYSVNQTIL